MMVVHARHTRHTRHTRHAGMIVTCLRIRLRILRESVKRQR